MRWQGAAAAVWAVGAMGLSFRDLDVAVLDGPDLIRLPRLLRRLRDEVRARDPDAAYARGCLRGACAGGRGVAYVRHADDRAPGPGAYSLHVGAFGPRGELEGPGVLCAGGGGDEAGGAACAGGVYAGRFRNDSLARGTLADPAAAEEYAGDFGADLRYDGLGVRTVAAKTRAGEFRRGAWRWRGCTRPSQATHALLPGGLQCLDGRPCSLPRGGGGARVVLLGGRDAHRLSDLPQRRVHLGALEHERPRRLRALHAGSLATWRSWPC